MKKNKTLWHFGKKSAGQTLKWLPTDTEESFQQLVQNEEYQEYPGNDDQCRPDAKLLLASVGFVNRCHWIDAATILRSRFPVGRADGEARRAVGPSVK